MADYFTHFSCVFDVGSEDNVTRALAIYADDNGLTFPDGFAAKPDESSATSLWIHDDGCGDVEQLIHFVLLCAETLDLNGLWGFEYALTCSRACLDAFGGAHVVDLTARTTHDWVNTTDWLAKVMAGDHPDA